MKYDYLIVGTGLFGSVFAYEANKAGKNVIAVEKRDHIGGNVYTQEIDGINVHRYGAHIFHTDNKAIWDYINQFARFNEYKHRVIANYNDKYYDLPFNMNTFKQMWGINTPEEAREIIEIQKAGIHNPSNLEEQCISLVGKDVYQTLVKGYTEKQWGRKCKDLPSFIIERLPVRFEYNSDYFDDKYQGIPIGGYTQIIGKMLEGIHVETSYDFLKHRNEINYDRLVYTGPIDAYYDYQLGYLEYRSLSFETEVYNIPYYQCNSVINYTDARTPFTRIIEHKYFENTFSDQTIITKEYPCEWKKGDEPYYPINDKRNMELFMRYEELAKKEERVIFGGRLGSYRYYDMDEIIDISLKQFAIHNKESDTRI